MTEERGRDATSAPGPRVQANRPFALPALVLLAVLLLLDRSRLAIELRFFQARIPLVAPGVAPVPQVEPVTPALDSSLRMAAAVLPRGAACVIAVDAWQHAYARASYLLMPRRIWPDSDHPIGHALSAAQIGQILALRHAQCLLAPPGSRVPSGLHLACSGAIDLYVSTGRLGGPLCIRR